MGSDCGFGMRFSVFCGRFIIDRPRIRPRPVFDGGFITELQTNHQRGARSSVSTIKVGHIWFQLRNPWVDGEFSMLLIVEIAAVLDSRYFY
jgi:hypothetical protein